MPELKNSEIIEYILRTLVDKIGRRTSESFAVVVIDTVMKELYPRYGFLRYIKVENTLYSEGMSSAVSVMPDIDSVEATEFYKAINDLIKMTVRHLERNADFFFIKELHEAIDDIDGLVLNDEKLDLGFMQFEYIAEKKQALDIKNSEITEQVIKALIYLTNRKFPEAEAIKTVDAAVKELEKNYGFLKNIQIYTTPDSKGIFEIRVLHDINRVWIFTMGETLQKLIEEVGKSVTWDADRSFIEVFKNELGEEHLATITKMGVNLDQIKLVVLQQGHEQVVKKTLETLVNIISKRTSKGFAMATVDTVLNTLREKHDILQYIKIDTSRFEEGIDAISIMPEINNVESYKLGKALREIIKISGRNLGHKTFAFIEEFKNQIGEKYLLEMEKMGVNLHFLELKFQ